MYHGRGAGGTCWGTMQLKEIYVVAEDGQVKATLLHSCCGIYRMVYLSIGGSLRHFCCA